MSPMEQRCRICNTLAKVEDSAETAGGVQVDECRCGVFHAEGRFWSAADRLRAEQPQRFQELCAWVAEENRHCRAPILTLDNWQTLPPRSPNRPT